MHDCGRRFVKAAMSSKILLISPNRCTSPDPVFPLGLTHVSAALERAGHVTRLLDLLTDPQPLAEVLREFRPDSTHGGFKVLRVFLDSDEAPSRADTRDASARASHVWIAHKRAALYLRLVHRPCHDRDWLLARVDSR